MSSTTHFPTPKMKASMAAAYLDAQRWQHGSVCRMYVISVALPDTPADTKCQFRALLPHIRLPFQRESCCICSICCISGLWQIIDMFLLTQRKNAFLAINRTAWHKLTGIQNELLNLKRFSLKSLVQGKIPLNLFS